MRNKGYFQPEQAREVAEVFAKHKIEYLFIGKSGAILLGYPATTQDVDLFPEKSRENCRRIVSALKEIGFELSEANENKIIRGVDFVQLNQDPFDLDLIFAPDGIESFEKARERMIVVENFPVANLLDIIASKKASNREKDLNDLPLLEDFRQEFEKRNRSELKTALELALEKTKNLTD
jgi:predicted nucleotidyltransferase